MSSTPSTTTPSANVCCICLETAQARGGVPLFSPGCCGKWFHQSCIDLVIANGDTKCPACRATFPSVNAAPAAPAANGLAPRRSFSNFFGLVNNNAANARAAPPVAPVANFVPPRVPQQQIQQQQINAPPASIFNTARRSPPAGNAEEDLLETPVAGSQTAKKSSSSEAPSLPVVVANTSPEFPVTNLNETSSFYVRVGLKFTENVNTDSEDKVPLDIVCILDNSGSMSGSKLASLKQAMNFVVGCLGPQDRLSIVYFNSYAGAVHGLLKMTPENKEKSRQLFSQLEATGGTDIYAGMQYGWNILENRRTQNPSSCVFLLTDGQDRGQLPAKQELARTIKARGSSLFVFGFGSDHDSEHMTAIANAGECPFTYIESDDMVVDAFGGSIGTQQGASLRNIRLTVTADAEGVTVAQAITGSYGHVISTNGRRVDITFANMYMGETRDIILRLNLPRITAANNEYSLVNASATYNVQVVGSNDVVGNSTNSNCVIRRVPNEEVDPSLTRDIEVDVQLNRIKSVEATTSAMASADASNFGVATDTLKAALEYVKASVSYRNSHRISLAIASDLNDALTRVQNRSSYAQGGRAMISETTTNNDRQRSCYTKMGRMNAYQSASSESCQTKAFQSKSSY